MEKQIIVRRKLPNDDARRRLRHEGRNDQRQNVRIVTYCHDFPDFPF